MVLQQEHNSQKDEILELKKRNIKLETSMTEFKVRSEILEKQLGGKGLATWTNPKGGYFISLDTNQGCAKRVVELANNAGVKLTAAGATFPYKKDPNDSNIRLAPTLPSVAEIKQAMEVVCLCVELADAEKNA